MTHVNCSPQKPSEVNQWLNVEKLETELKFKNRVAIEYIASQRFA